MNGVNQYVKHLIECKCIHPRFQSLDEVVPHRFVVFSELNENTGAFIEHYAQCDNCGLIHRVNEVGKSTPMMKDSLSNIIDTDEIALELPDKIVDLLKKYNCPTHVWQETKFIFEKKLWGSFIVLTREDTGYGGKVGKILHINGESSYKIESFEDDFTIDV